MDGFPQPLHAAYDRRVAPHAAARLERRGASPRELLASPNLRVIDAILDTFMNLNPPDDYARALRTLEGSTP